MIAFNRGVTRASDSEKLQKKDPERDPRTAVIGLWYPCRVMTPRGQSSAVFGFGVVWTSYQQLGAPTSEMGSNAQVPIVAWPTPYSVPKIWGLFITY